LKETVRQLIDKWNPDDESSCVFSTSDNREQSKSRYFLDSGDKISFFIEEDSIDSTTSDSIETNLDLLAMHMFLTIFSLNK
jgi:hypothetical protein